MPEMIVKLCRKHQITLPGANRGKVALFQVAHEHCHRDSLFSRQLQRYFNAKHTTLITQLAQLQPEALSTTVESLLSDSQTILPDTLPGILWAICSDPREAVRPIEKSLIDELHWLSHCMLLAQFQGDVQIVRPEEQMSQADRETLKKALEQLKVERSALRNEVRHLKNVEIQLTRDNTHLQYKCDALEQRCKAIEKQRQTAQVTTMPERMAPRELKKLHYKLAKQTEVLDEKEDEIQRLTALVSSYQSMTTDCMSQTIGGRQISQLEPELPSLNLNGKTIALIGGLTKASIYYEQEISQLGGNCIRHDGTAHQGHKKLAKVIRQADVVFCPVNCVSHGTAISAKKLCRTFDKPCFFLQSSGSSHIREKLREVALMPGL